MPQKGLPIVNQLHTMRLASWARLVALSLMLGFGLLTTLVLYES